MKKAFVILTLSILLFGCNMNPNKEARIQKLETELQLSIEKINQLEEKVTTLEKNNEILKSKIEEIKNQ